MTDPTPLSYQTPQSPSGDLSSLRVLSILHYVWGGLIMLFSCFFLIYIIVGILMASGAMNMRPPAAPGMSRTVTATAGPPPEIGYLFVIGGGCGLIFGWAIGICTIISGRKMATRRSRIFSIVIAGINCISFPLGTTLGVFTIIVLAKQSVKDLYAGII